MGTRVPAPLLLALLAVAARPAAGQEVEVGLAGGRVTDERGEAHAALTVSPSLRWSSPGSSFGVGARGTVFPGGLFGTLEAGGEVEAVRQGPVRIVLSGEGDATASAAGHRALRGAFHPRIRLAGGGWGIEAGPLLAGGGARDGAPAGGPLGMLPGERSALDWRDERGLAASAWGRRGVASARGGWRGREVAGARWQEWTGAASVDLGDLGIGLSAGRRTGDLRGTWVAASAAARLSGDLSLLAGAGAYPSDPLMGRAAGRFASVGIALRPGGRTAPPAPLTVPAPDRGGSIRLALRARPGARVELLADWTGWESRPVPETAAGEYAVAVALPAGLHRFLFRVDGEWRIPDGFSTEPDGFGGKHAVIRVR